MNIINFINRFHEEASCIDFIKEQRSQLGIICKKCIGSRHYWLKNKHSFQCASCGFRTSIRSGSVMKNSNLPIRIWMMAMTYITSTKKGFSATELQKQLGMKRYEPVFRMYHILRTVMGQRDNRYRLEDMVEYEEDYVGKSTKAQVRS
jgi:hypothetical protein